MSEPRGKPKRCQSFTAKLGECQVCAAEGILPSEAIACYMHSTMTINQLQAEVAVLKDTASASSKLHMALADMHSAVPSVDGSEELQFVVDLRARLDRVEKLLQYVALVAQWDDGEAAKLEAELFGGASGRRSVMRDPRERALSRLWKRLRLAVVFRVWPWRIPANVVTHVAIPRPPTPADVKRGQQLAAKYGWTRDDAETKDPAPMSGESREEFERDRMGETGERLAERTRAEAAKSGACLRCQELEAELKAITPGDWGVEHQDYLSIIANPSAPTYEWKEVALVPEGPEDGITKTQQEANAAFIAAAPRRIRELCASLSALQAVLGEIRPYLQHLPGCLWWPNNPTPAWDGRPCTCGLDRLSSILSSTGGTRT